MKAKENSPNQNLTMSSSCTDRMLIELFVWLDFSWLSELGI